jgi:hypothetical protein
MLIQLQLVLVEIVDIRHCLGDFEAPLAEIEFHVTGFEIRENDSQCVRILLLKSETEEIVVLPVKLFDLIDLIVDSL